MFFFSFRWQNNNQDHFGHLTSKIIQVSKVCASLTWKYSSELSSAVLPRQARSSPPSTPSNRHKARWGGSPRHRQGFMGLGQKLGYQNCQRNQSGHSKYQRLPNHPPFVVFTCCHSDYSKINDGKQWTPRCHQVTRNGGRWTPAAPQQIQFLQDASKFRIAPRCIPLPRNWGSSHTLSCNLAAPAPTWPTF